MQELKLKDRAKAIAFLANDGLKATTDCFTLIAFETYDTHTKPEALKRFKSASQAITALTNSIVLIGVDISNAKPARELIYFLYPELIGPEKDPNIPGPRPKKSVNMARQVLLLLISLAEKYKALMTAAKQFSEEQTTFEELKQKVTEANYVYGKAKDWAELYPKEYKGLLDRNGMTSIMKFVETMEKQIEEKETKKIAASATRVVQIKKRAA